MQAIQLHSCRGEVAASARFAASSCTSKRSTRLLGRGAPTARLGRGGCTIYETRPTECREFFCSWLTSPALGPKWRPNKCKMFVRHEGNLIAIHVDPSDPTAWQREPFFQQIKAFATRAADTKQQVAVYIKNRVIVIFPHKEVDVGTINPGDHLVVR